MARPELSNWKRTITYHPGVIETVAGVEDIVRIVSDTRRYPSPVRVKGSHHSTTRCIVAEGGTVIDITRLDRILDIDVPAQTITMQAGVLLIDAARELEKHGLQFHVNIELGNLTVGSGACAATKDASYPARDGDGFEYGQVASYVVRIKAVGAQGQLLEFTDADGERMQAMRSSYGMLGVIYEVTYKVKPIRAMAVEHMRYSVDEFATQLEELVASRRSMMLYLFPYLDSVVVEYRQDTTQPIRPRAWQWRLRNWVWKTGSPGFARIVSTLVPLRRLRSLILDSYDRLSRWVIVALLRARDTSPADQIIRYPATAGFSSYTFSIWAFPREEYPQTLRAYFQFCRDYFERHGYRCDLLNVGYSISQDTRSLFSYTRHGPALTLDPVSTGAEGWEAFLDAYNVFCSEHNGTPLFNQTRGITPAQARRALGPEIELFKAHRQALDPEGRFYNDYFRVLFE